MYVFFAKSAKLVKLLIFCLDIDQWMKIIEKIGSPPSQFINRLSLNIRDYVANLPQHKANELEILFPNDLFSTDIPNTTLTAESARDLIGKMLRIDPLERISVDEALNHPYVNVWYDIEDINYVI